MKIIDIDSAINNYNNENEIEHNLRDNKYLLLELGNEVYSLEITNVSKEAIWLKPVKRDIEKRFTMADGTYPPIVIFDGDKGLSYFDVIDLLNEQHEIIKELKDMNYDLYQQLKVLRGD